MLKSAVGMITGIIMVYLIGVICIIGTNSGNILLLKDVDVDKKI